MNKYVKYFLTLVAILIFSVACKDSSTEPENTEPRAFNLKKIEVPEALKNVSDPKAQATVAYVNITNLSQTTTAMFNIPQGVSSDGGQYTWTRGTLSITMFYSENNGNSSWKLVMNGTEDGVLYNNWVAIEASQSADEENGWTKIYEENSTVIASEWNWTTDSNGKYSFTLTSNDGTETSKLTVISNPDESGEVLFYENNILQSKSVWSANGSGEWWEYDSQGNVTNTGTWNAPT